MVASTKELIERFEFTEAPSLPQERITLPILTAVGSVAAKALESPLLKEHFAERGLKPKSIGPCASIKELSSREGWSLALVLSWTLALTLHNKPPRSAFPRTPEGLLPCRSPRPTREKPPFAASTTPF